jgi:hypothetical protein
MARPSTLSEFYAQAQQAVLTLTGAEAMYLRAIEALPEAADEEGRYLPFEEILYLHPRKVAAWIDVLLDRKVVDDGEVDAVLNALVTVFHEMVHAIGPADRGKDAGRSIYLLKGLKGPVDYEQAIAELTARVSLSPFVERLEVGDRLPSPLEFNSMIYVSKIAAAGAVIDKFAEEAGMGFGNAVLLMAAEVPDTRGHAVATTLADRRGHRNLPGRARFIERVERAFQDLQQVPDVTADGYAGWAREQLRAAIVRGDSEAR